MTEPGVDVAASEHEDPAAAPSDGGEIPAKIDHYAILRRLGAGGMGVVYEAYDTRLARKIALKLIHQHSGDFETHVTLRHTLYAEAQSMAKMSHPNIVSIFDVGRWENQLYLAMELIRGVTMRQWLQEGTRSAKDILHVMCSAGAGLAAVHRQGLAHRDFKPENVMIDESGRVFVTDFGLAGAESRSSGLSRAKDGAEGSTATQLTRSISTGLVGGTPAYMAPEQFDGAIGDARSDQYSFCVTLFEALTGERPSQAQLFQGLVSAPKRGRARIPRRILAIARRGLELHPERRFPTMDALLEALRDANASFRGSWVLASGTSTLLSLGMLAFGGLADKHRADCVATFAETLQTWDEPARQAVARAFAASAQPRAARAFDHVDVSLRMYQRELAEQAKEVCGAGRSDLVASDLDLRVICLRRAAKGFTSLVALFSTANPETVERAGKALDGLPDLESCSDVQQLRERVPDALPPEIAAEVEAVQLLLTESQSLAAAGRTIEARRNFLDAATRATKVRHLPLIAEAYIALASSFTVSYEPQAAIAANRTALTAALAAGNEPLTALSALQLHLVEGYVLRRDNEPDLRAQTEAFLQASADDPGLRGQFAINVGNVSWARGDFQAARAWYTRGVEHLRISHVDAHPVLAAAIGNLGLANYELHDYEAALSQLRESIDMFERSPGALSPGTALMYNNLAVVLMAVDRKHEADEAWVKASDVCLETNRRQVNCSHYLLTRAGAAMRSGDYASAWALYDRTAKLQESEGTRGAEFTWWAWEPWARMALQLGREDEALSFAEKAFDWANKDTSLPPEMRIEAHVSLARALLAKGEIPRAETAIAGAENTSNIAHGRRRVSAETMLTIAKGELALARGDCASAAMHARAVELQSRGATAIDRAFASNRSFVHAKILRICGHADEALRLLESEEQRELPADPEVETSTAFPRLRELALTYWALRREDAAWEATQRALGSAQQHFAPNALADLWFISAQIKARRGEKTGALRDAEAARAGYETSLPSSANDVLRVARWIAAQ